LIVAAFVRDGMPKPIAGPASARTVGKNVSVRFVKGVPVLAVGLAPIAEIGPLGSQASLPFAPPLATACTAHALAIRCDIHVVTLKRVAVGAMSFASVVGSRARAAQDVLARAGGLQVIGVHADGVAAEVVEDHPVWDRAVFALPSLPPCSDCLPVPIKEPISSAVRRLNAPSPDPAASSVRHVFRDRAVPVDLLFSLFIGKGGPCHANTFYTNRGIM